MILLGDLYCIIIVVYLLQLYQSCSRLLGYINHSSPLGYLLRYLLGHPLEYLLEYFLEYPLGYYLVYLLRHLIKTQNYYLYNRASQQLTKIGWVHKAFK